MALIVKVLDFQMDKYVKSVKDDLKESIDFFRNERKGERELWVLHKFLSFIIPDFGRTGTTMSDSEPNDVCYGEIGFQVKEILSEQRERTREYKDSLSKITDDTQLKDLVEPLRQFHIPFNDASERLLSELERHRTKKYHNQTSDMNVLVYLNLKGETDTTTFDETPVDMSLFSEEVSKWGSVSVVTNNCAIVLGVKENALPFFDGVVGELLFKPLG